MSDPEESSRLKSNFIIENNELLTTDDLSDKIKEIVKSVLSK